MMHVLLDDECVEATSDDVLEVEYSGQMVRFAFAALSAASLLLALSGCSDDDFTPDAPDDTTDVGDVNGDTPMSSCDPLPDPIAEGQGTAHPEPLSVGTGEARVGRLTAAQIPADTDSLLRWGEGDWVLANEHVAFVVEELAEGTYDSDGYDPWSGKLVGIAQMEGGALVLPADFNELTVALSRYTIRPSSITVVNDGSDGNAAVLRVIGDIESFPFVGALAVLLFPGGLPDGVRIAIDYTLEPGAHHVALTHTLYNPTSRNLVPRVSALSMQLSRMPAYFGQNGFESATRPYDYLAFIEEEATSYAVDLQTGDMEPFLELSGALLVTASTARFEACSVNSVASANIYAAVGLDGLKRVLADARSETLREITGTVETSTGAPAAGVRVHATGAEGVHLSRTLTAADGSYALAVPANLAVTLSAYIRGQELVESTLGATDTDGGTMTLAPAGTLVVRATESGAPVPVRVQVMPDGATAFSPPTNWGEAIVPHGRTFTVFPGVSGEARFELTAGNYQVIVSRGFEYELGLNQVVTVNANTETEVSAELQRVVNTQNHLCADYHIHTFRSPDAPDSDNYKLRAAAGDGLEIPLRSEHEWIASWDSAMSEENLAPFLFGITSLELTTFEWGHFGIFPLEADEAALNGGAPYWYGQGPVPTFEAAAAGPTDPAIIVNHPNSALGQGYLAWLGYDRETNMVNEERTGDWDESLTLYEMFNNVGIVGNEELVQDWFALLNSGKRIFAVGSSDSHTALNNAVGYPRSCLELGTDDPAELESLGGAELVRDTTLTGDFVVYGGIYLTVEGSGGAGPGDTIAGASAMETLTVSVQAASWIDVDELELYVDGVLVSTTPVGAGDGVDRGTYMVEVPVASAGSWAIVHAKGDLPLSPVFVGRLPFGISQPIFFER